MAQELTHPARRPTINIASSTPPVRRTTLGLPIHRPTLPLDVDPRLMPQSVPNPSHRHGTPSGPWPFLDLNTTIDPKDILEPEIDSATCTHRRHAHDQHCWCQYPQSLFPNWSHTQQKSSRITKALRNVHGWMIYSLFVTHSGHFRAQRPIPGRSKGQDAFWEVFRAPQESDFHVHALFIDNMAGAIMQMLGTKYNIEPFFFSSSFGWIPSRYQANAIPGESDHITITLTFIRSMDDPANYVSSPASGNDNATNASDDENDTKPKHELAIDTNAPLYLRSNQKIIFADILSLHLIRNPKAGNTIISYHPPREFRATSAKALHDRFQLTGSSVYWSKIFARSKDPTFVLLSLLWYALYAWDQSFEELYAHICYLESKVMDHNDLDFTHELHIIRANLLHYTSLLKDFRKTVQFVLDTPFPALENPAYFTKEQKWESEVLMKKECTTLLNEIERLEMGRQMHDKRLKNVMNLGFSTVQIEESKYTQSLTRAAVRDSAAMKQIAYLTMIFLPASFVAAIFGMNVVEINPTNSSQSLGHYFAVAIPLTILTIWIIGALQFPIKDDPQAARGRHRAYATTTVRTASSGQPELRRAYTTPDGILVGGGGGFQQPEPLTSGNNSHSDEDDDDDYQYNLDKYDIEGDAIPRIQHFGVWKRLGWPISLTKVFIKKWWKEKKRRDRMRKRNLPPPLPLAPLGREVENEGGRVTTIAASAAAAGDNPNPNTVTPTTPPTPDPNTGKDEVHSVHSTTADSGPVTLAHAIVGGGHIETAAATTITENTSGN